MKFGMIAIVIIAAILTVPYTMMVPENVGWEKMHPIQRIYLLAACAGWTIEAFSGVCLMALILG